MAWLGDHAINPSEQHRLHSHKRFTKKRRRGRRQRRQPVNSCTDRTLVCLCKSFVCTSRRQQMTSLLDLGLCPSASSMWIRPAKLMGASDSGKSCQSHTCKHVKKCSLCWTNASPAYRESVNKSAASAASPDYVKFQPVIKSAASAASLWGGRASGRLDPVSYTHLTLPTTPYV